MSSGPSTVSLADAAKAIGDLLEQGTKIGMGLLESIKLPLPSKSCGCNCQIPPPCWEPQPIGDVTTRACPGNKAVLRLHDTDWVFVPIDGQRFRRTEIQAGRDSQGVQEVLSGLRPGDRVVANALQLSNVTRTP